MRGAAVAGAAALVLAGAAAPARAVITIVTDTGSSYGLVLRVGSAGTTVDTVAFSVTGANAGLTPTPVTGTPSITVWVTPVRPIANNTTARPVTLRVDSSSGLLCQWVGCGSIAIPFSKVSWTATGNDNAASGDIQSGSFDTTANQTIASYNANATFCTGLLGLPCVLGIGTWTYQSRQLSSTTLQFKYANDTVYPGGTYMGTVRFTASME
ncbi:hypothetical protein [Variovorax sp. PAMC26660]|uniref:hypothetical protein n=1 Tax=Variovorax sp. PAMC26660 TaxID=2762322 RepID=UPI00164E4251|nr:hypothetical protein [Variovorax sp. PAMC26660]QNK69937.1 hypothetical protein H7F35_09710 [Variovorax sp. PAMC26660]